MGMRPSRVLVALTLAGLALPAVAMASSHKPNLADGAVLVEAFAFAPSAVTIPTGASVTWTIGTDPEQHTVTPTDDSAFAGSGQLFTGDTFSVRFETAGAFDYLCTLHPFMTGTVTVVAAESPAPTVATPTVAAVSPTVAAVSPSAAAATTAPVSSASASSTPASSSGGSDSPVPAVALIALILGGGVVVALLLIRRRRPAA